MIYSGDKWAARAKNPFSSPVGGWSTCRRSADDLPTVTGKSPLSPCAVSITGAALGDFFVARSHVEQRKNGSLCRKFPASPAFCSAPGFGKIRPWSEDRFKQNSPICRFGDGRWGIPDELFTRWQALLRGTGTRTNLPFPGRCCAVPVPVCRAQSTDHPADRHHDS